MVATHRRSLILLVLFLVVAAAGGALLSTAGAQQAGPADGNVTITVGASGAVTAPPDQAVIDLAVEASAESADEARGLVADDVSQLREALTEAGVADEDVRTTSFAIQPERDDEGNVTYRAVHALELRVPVDDAGAMVDLAVANGATRVNGVQFTLAEETRDDLRADALRSALENARGDADVIANASGVEVQAVHTVETGDGGVQPVFLEADRAAGTTFDPGPVTVTAHVTVTYRAN